ncbi:hypothetical protein [Aneurinibacillus thermoaerophilus]|uniref:hypothetical protein n=1 Tax=Aneurinibacillus thermoaerophilus TaxID=143495 RepID=UPI002E20A460|nr:hypothetical protein [Aneurinibacillus thermoaerophilus]
MFESALITKSFLSSSFDLLGKEKILLDKEKIKIMERNTPHNVLSMAINMENSRYIVLNQSLSFEEKKREISFQIKYHLQRKGDSESISFLNINTREK